MCKNKVQEYLATCAMLFKQQSRSATGEETMSCAQSCDTKQGRHQLLLTGTAIASLVPRLTESLGTWLGHCMRSSVNKLGGSGGMLPQENFYY